MQLRQCFETGILLASQVLVAVRALIHLVLVATVARTRPTPRAARVHPRY